MNWYENWWWLEAGLVVLFGEKLIEKWVNNIPKHVRKIVWRKNCGKETEKWGTQAKLYRRSLINDRPPEKRDRNQAKVRLQETMAAVLPWNVMRQTTSTWLRQVAAHLFRHSHGCECRCWKVAAALFQGASFPQMERFSGCNPSEKLGIIIWCNVGKTW